MTTVTIPQQTNPAVIYSSFAASACTANANTTKIRTIIQPRIVNTARKSFIVSSKRQLVHVGKAVQAILFEIVPVFDGIAVLKATGGNRNIVKTLTETVAISETLSRMAAKTRTRTETVTISESIARVKGINRSLTETVAVTAGTLARMAAKIRSKTETVAVSESVARLSNKIRALATQTVAVSESVIRVKGIVRAVPAQTVAISESLARQAAKIRSKTETVTITESVTRLTTKVRALATQTVAISETVTRVKGIVRAVPTQTVAISETIARQAKKIRSRTETVTISESQSRSVGKIRALATQTVTISESLSRLKGVVRALATQTVTVSETLSRLAAKTRTLATQTVTVSESVTQVKAGAKNIVKSLTETVTVGAGTVARQAKKIRTASELVTITEVMHVFKNGIELVKPQRPDKGGFTTRLYQKYAPKLKQIRYPVYHVTDLERLRRRERLREYPPLVIIPAFQYNINETVAPFIVTPTNGNRIIVRFAISQDNTDTNRESKQPHIVFAGRSIPVRIDVPIVHKRAVSRVNKAKCDIVMSQQNLQKYSKRLQKFAKLMNLWFMAQRLKLFSS